MMRGVFFAASCAALVLAGCGRPSSTAYSANPIAPPLTGKWVGQAKLATGNDLVKLKDALSGGKMTGPSSLVLNPDGTGFLKVAKQPEHPVTWKQEGKKIIVQRGGDSYVATLSDNGRSMAIDMGDLKVSLTRSGDTR